MRSHQFSMRRCDLLCSSGSITLLLSWTSSNVYNSCVFSSFPFLRSKVKKCIHMSRAAFERRSVWREAAGGMEGMFSTFLSTSPAEGKANEAKCRAALRRLPGQSGSGSCCCASHEHRVYLQWYLFFNYLATLQALTCSLGFISHCSFGVIVVRPKCCFSDNQIL